MKYYTKEWYELTMSVGMADMFEPVVDREYSDEDIEQLYQEMLEKHVQEERDMYDEPPFFAFDFEEDIDPEDFDPEDFIIGDLTEDGDEVNMRHPKSYEELAEYQRMEYEYALKEYEEREPFDEELAAEEFEEEYKDNLEEPDEDVPQWVRDMVDPRLIAMWLLPEKIFRKLAAEDAERQEKLDVIDEAAESALEDIYEELPEDLIAVKNDLSWIEGDYLIDICREDGDLELVTSGWDEEGDPVKRLVRLEGAEVTEDEKPEINSEEDEDGDLVSDCDIAALEFYFEDGRIQLHLLLDNEDKGLKYFTVSCEEIFISQESLA